MRGSTVVLQPNVRQERIVVGVARSQVYQKAMLEECYDIRAFDVAAGCPI
jgi:hypothetical protein